MTCWCGRESRGRGLHNYKDRSDKRYWWFCSDEHLKLWKDKKVQDFTKFEVAALEFAGTMAGEYMAEIKKTDLRTFSKEEWMTLLKVINGNTCAEVGRIAPKNTSSFDEEIPF